MATFSLNQPAPSPVEAKRGLRLTLRQETSRRQVVWAMILAIAVYQLLSLPGALMNHRIADIGTIALGLFICGMAALFNRLGKVTIVGILLIIVIDLGCGLMLLTSSMGLDVGDLPIFDALLVCDLIAVTLLPAWSVFPIATANIIFILADITFQPHTPELTMMLHSSMAYMTVMQPVSLQIVVAVVAYILVRSASRAIAQADRADEVAALRQREVEYQRREVEQKRQLESGIEQLSQTLTRAANGERTAVTNLSQEHVLWRLGSSINILLARFWRADQAELQLLQAEHEKQRLHREIVRLNEEVRVARTLSYKTSGALKQERGQLL